MKTFNYTANHKEDEAYMQEMCHCGYAAEKLVEGFWTFKACAPDQYTYRVAYFRGMKEPEREAFKRECHEKGIEFVSQYAFWAIFRSAKPFVFYEGMEEIEICEKIYHPMPAGAAVSAAVLMLSMILIFHISKWFLILSLLSIIYGTVCIRCAFSYRKLISALKRKIVCAE